MSAFSSAMVALFGDPNMAEDATYTPAATGVAATVRVIYTAPDVANQWGDTAIRSDSVLLDVLVAEVAAPVAGDQITWRGEARVVQGSPERDVERLTWVLDTRPA